MIAPWNYSETSLNIRELQEQKHHFGPGPSFYLVPLGLGLNRARPTSALGPLEPPGMSPLILVYKEECLANEQEHCV